MGSVDPRYDKRDFATPTGIRNANYDRLRDSGVSREDAARIAEKSIDKTLKKIDKGPGWNGRGQVDPTTLAGATDGERHPFRVRFPWEPAEAGIDIEPGSRKA